MPGDTTPGRRRPDVPFGELPDDLEPGDYWKYLDRETGEPMAALDAPENLTGTVWGCYSPDGNGVGTLMKHTVREHEDATASVRPGDGSSNSIAISVGGRHWHGYLERGVWREA